MLVCTSMLILSAFTAAATTITDPTGDVWHWAQTGTIWEWSGNVANKPNIDITSLGGTVTADKLTLTMTVAGSIESSGKIIYVMFYNCTNTSYSIFWTNGSGTGIGRGSIINISNPAGGNELADSVIASGKTITAIFTVIGNTTVQKVRGWAYEYTAVKNQTAEWWGDWAPNSEQPSYIPWTGNNTGNNTQDGNNTNGGKKTPGFEVLPVLAAVAIAAILLKRRR